MARKRERQNRAERVRAAKQQERFANEEFAAEYANASGKDYDIKARNTALEVLGLLQEFGDERPSGPAETEEQRVAANLMFLHSLCAQYINRFMDHPQIAEAELERYRIAQDSLLMLNDVATLHRHPIHRFFHGCESGLKSSGPSSKQVAADCRVIACYEAVGEAMRASTGKKSTQSAIVDLMLGYPAISNQLGSLTRLQNLQYGPARTARYAHQIKSCRSMLRWGAGINATPEQMMAWTDAALLNSERPLSFDEAARVERQGIARRTPTGLEILRPRPLPLPAISQRPSLLAISKLKGRRR